VFAAALKLDATAIILAHNHPSGDPTPSLQDKQLTGALTSLGETLGVRVLDHLVVCRSRGDRVVGTGTPCGG